MESLYSLTDEQVLTIYHQAIEANVVREFIEMVRHELCRRGLSLT